MTRFPSPAVRSVALVALSCGAAAFGLPGAHAAEHSPGRFAVAAENESSARAAMQVLESGGSAADAAIAASLMLGVTAPVSCGLGGGGFALVFDAAEKKSFVLDYREMAPAHYDLAALESKGGGSKIGIPGEVAGLVELHRRWGSRSFAEDVAPAARAAEKGFSVSRHLARSLVGKVELITSGPLAAIFARGPVAKEGTTVVNLPLAITLERIGREGSRAFYEGAVAADLLQTAVAAGSPWSASDLADYYVAPREPLRGRWEGYEIATMPPPSAGGLMLLETLALYSRAELRNMSEGTANYSHMVAEAMRGAIADRMRAVGDPAFAPDRSAALLEPARLAARRLHIGYERTHAPPRFELSESGTSHLVVVDAKGNVVSMTTTINNPFGSGVLAAASGVLLNDELRDFTPPETAALFDGAPGPNAPKGKARPVSSMTPTIVFRDGVPVLAAGGSGGLRIAQNVTQAVLNRLAFDKGARRAVAAPRFFAPTTEPSLIYAEADLPPADVQLDLTEKGEQIKAISDNTSAVQMITWSRTSSGGFSLDAAADPRKGGVGLVK